MRIGFLLPPCLIPLLGLLHTAPADAASVWVEGEKPAVNHMNRHPWWYDQVKREQFSGGDFISNFSAEKAGDAEYEFSVKEAGSYDFWVRANPLSTALSYTLNSDPERVIDLEKDKRELTNVAADGKPDLRFIAWSRVGPVQLNQGNNKIRFRMTSANSHHGYLDCFVFSTEPFAPRGLLKPGEKASPAALSETGWVPFAPEADAFKPSAIDLRHLNEKVAGESGPVTVRNGEFILGSSGQPVRFWAVNGPPHELRGDALRECARMLAKRGVNLVRVHGGYFDSTGEVDLKKVAHTQEVVDAMKAEGIYTHLSIYFPLWIQPKPDNHFLKGYDGKKHPFAALFFNPGFQEQYRTWWKAVLKTPNPATGKCLADDPAVAGLEIQNEDSLFFWTFDEKNIPDEQLIILEKRFGDWLARKHGSIEKALSNWKGLKLKRDVPEEGRVGFRALWAIFTEKTGRDQETARFLTELQTGFYRDTYQFLRDLGFKAAINASNWSTASPEVFGPLEKLSYSVCDFIDRHGYFSCNHKGEAAEWSIRNGHTYSECSALRFDGEQPGKPRQFVHPAMDPHYDGKPSMISETTWNRPNRHRGEAPLYLAAYGALQHSDAIVHFALDGATWSVKPGFFMQPWTLMSPTMAGQFPAAALIYRRGLVHTGKTVATVALNRQALFGLEGTPLPQEASLDELRLKDLPSGHEPGKAARLNPLLFYVGRTDVRFTDGPASVNLADTASLIDPRKQTVTSSTGELRLDYGTGLLVLNAPAVQGVSGALAKAGRIETRDLIVESPMEVGHIVAVALDEKPISESARILLQVMSEEKPSGFKTEAASDGVYRITDIGHDPWLIRELAGTVRLKNGNSVSATALDPNGYGAEKAKSQALITLKADTLYYLLER